MQPIMNKLLITLAGALTLGAALPVFAGPDWQIIEKARKEKQAAQLAQHDDAVQPAAAQNCPPEPLVLPLDHGPPRPKHAIPEPLAHRTL